MLRNSLAVALLAFLSVPFLVAQEAIRYQADKKLWTLQMSESTYAFGVNERGELQSLYWGARIDQDQDFAALQSKPEWASFDLTTTMTHQEYAGWGAGLNTEPALKATFVDGNRSLVLHYQSHSAKDNLLEIVLKDIVAPLYVHLYYRVYPEQGILERWTKIENKGKDAIHLESAASATWTLPQGKGYAWNWLTGRWAGEWQLHSEAIQNGSFVIESRRGSTSHQANPWFAVYRPEETTEESGPVWFGELGWSGSWRIALEDTSWDQIRITGGYNPFDFDYRLAVGESLETPPFYAGFTAKGKGEASRLLHRFQLANILPGHPSPKFRPILYNSWEATEFAVNEAGQLALAEKAAKMGVERFVIDDGWFGQRKDDHRGLGDWYVNPEKFPHGLKPIIDRVHSLGMDFGIWVEPEMVNPDSDLYRKHPEWAMNFAGRPRTEGRNQLLLNLARKDVKEYVFGFLDKLVTENDIAFLKWDYNRNWSEPGWDAVPVEDQKKIYVKYVENLYDILDRLRAKHPKLEIESCSGGGGRVDLGILKRTEEIWTSDNTDAFDRIIQQNGFTHAYTPEVMMAWVTDVPNSLNRRSVPLEYRFLSAMEGSLGVGGNLNKWSQEELDQAQKLIAYYKKIRMSVQKGRLYRLREPHQFSASATEYVSADGAQAVVFAFQQAQNFGTPYPNLYLRGLDPNARYRLTPLDAKKAKLPAEVSGAYLMHLGVDLGLRGDYDSTSLLVERMP